VGEPILSRARGVAKLSCSPPNSGSETLHELRALAPRVRCRNGSFTLTVIAEPPSLTRQSGRPLEPASSLSPVLDILMQRVRGRQRAAGTRLHGGAPVRNAPSASCDMPGFLLLCIGLVLTPYSTSDLSELATRISLIRP
jgi:hypothetical protein